MTKLQELLAAGPQSLEKENAMMKDINVSRPRSGLNIYLTEQAALALGGLGQKVDLSFHDRTVTLIQKRGARTAIVVNPNGSLPFRLTYGVQSYPKVSSLPSFGSVALRYEISRGSMDGLGMLTFEIPEDNVLPAPLSMNRPTLAQRRPPVVRGDSVATAVKTPREQLRDTVAKLNELLEKGHAEGIQWDWVYLDQGPSGNVDPVVKTLQMPGKLRGRLVDTFE